MASIRQTRILPSCRRTLQPPADPPTPRRRITGRGITDAWFHPPCRVIDQLAIGAGRKHRLRVCAGADPLKLFSVKRKSFKAIAAPARGRPIAAEDDEVAGLVTVVMPYSGSWLQSTAIWNAASRGFGEPDELKRPARCCMVPVATLLGSCRSIKPGPELGALAFRVSRRTPDQTRQNASNHADGGYGIHAALLTALIDFVV